jgi:hypothetical protein
LYINILKNLIKVFFRNKLTAHHKMFVKKFIVVHLI